MELFVFTTNLEFALKAESAGVSSVIIDWEYKGKKNRQKGYDCEINKDTSQDIHRLATNLKIPVTVRINAYGSHSEQEMNCAISSGASIIMLPMARTVSEVNNFLNLANGRVRTIVQIETLALIQDINSFATLGWDYAYIGLNDLMIARRDRCIWKLLLDGSVETICNALRGRNYGFGGITVLGGGSPVNIELLLHEYVRLDCSLCFLRRSFFKEILDRNPQTEIPLVKFFIENSKQRGPVAMANDQNKLKRLLAGVVDKYG